MRGLRFTSRAAHGAVPAVQFFRHVQAVRPVPANIAATFHAFRNVTVGPHAATCCRQRATSLSVRTALVASSETAEGKGPSIVSTIRIFPRTCGGRLFCPVGTTTGTSHDWGGSRSSVRVALRVFAPRPWTVAFRAIVGSFAVLDGFPSGAGPWTAVTAGFGVSGRLWA